MTRFATAGHLASWAGVCPGNDESAGKRRSGTTRKGSKWLRQTLTECAKAVARTKDTYLAAQHARMRVQWRQPRDHCGRTLDPRRRLAHAADRRDLHRPRRRLLPAPRPRAPHQRLVAQLERLGHTVILQEDLKPQTDFSSDRDLARATPVD